MIKILKDGVIPKQKKLIFKTTCKNCDCEFEFELEDCSRVEKSLNGHITVGCPCCYARVIRARNELEAREEEIK